MSGIITELFVRRNHGTKTGRVSYTCDCPHELLHSAQPVRFRFRFSVGNKILLDKAAGEYYK